MTDAMPEAVAAPVVGRGATDAFIALVDVLGREQRLLEQLAFNVAQASLLIAAGEDRLVTMANAEMERTEQELGFIEVARAMVASELASQWCIPEDQPTLATIITVAPEAYVPVLERYRSELSRLSENIATTASTGRELAADGVRRTTDAVARIETARPADAYGSDGSPLSSPASSGLADRFA